jgi:tetratricopeptide (TPR) repeat protein
MACGEFGDMRLPRRTILLVLLLAGSFGTYKLGVYLWGVHRYRAAEAAINRRDFAAARAALKECLVLWPTNGSLRLLAAQTARRDGDTAEALYQLRARTDTKGGDEARALEVKLIRVQAGEMREADCLLQSCFDEPKAAQTPLVLEAVIEGSLRALFPAFAAAGMVEPKAAAPEIARLRRGVDLWLACRPARADQVQGLVWRGRLHGYASEYASAVADLRSALEQDPNHFAARWYLAFLVIRVAPEEAVTHLQALWQRHLHDDQVGLPLAGLCRSLGKLEEARQLLDEILASQPQNVAALIERGQVCLDTQQVADAELYLRRAEDLAPNNPALNLALCRCMQLSGRPDDAKLYRARFEAIDAERQRQQDRSIAKTNSAHRS